MSGDNFGTYISRQYDKARRASALERKRKASQARQSYHDAIAAPRSKGRQSVTFRDLTED